MREVAIDPVRNTLRVGVRLVRGRGRWEAAALLAMVRMSPHPLSAGTLNALLAAAGQRTPLDRSGVRRLLYGVRSMVDEALGPGSFAARVKHGPRQSTVGPWYFATVGDESWFALESAPGQVQPIPARSPPAFPASFTPAAARPAPQVCVPRTSAAQLVRLVELVIRADALALEGKLTEARAHLGAALSIEAATPEMRGLLELRLARVLKCTGMFDQAAELAAAVARLAREPGFADPALFGRARQLLRRVAYDRSPHRFGGDTADCVPVPFHALLVPDPAGVAEAANLDALITRRQALEAWRAGNRQEAVAGLRVAWRSACAALYLALSLRDFESCQNYTFNMGLIQSSLHDLGKTQAAAGAFACYRLGLLIRDNFMVGKDSAWDQICVASLWLDTPQHRAEFDRALAFDGVSPGHAAFYDKAIEEAVRVGEPRQIGVCCALAWRFATEVAVGSRGQALRRRALERLNATAEKHPQLIPGLRRDSPEVMARMLGPPVATVASPPSRRGGSRALTARRRASTA